MRLDLIDELRLSVYPYVAGSRTRSLDRRRLWFARESTVQIPGMGESAVSDNEADEMEEHLRGLGYIE